MHTLHTQEHRPPPSSTHTTSRGLQEGHPLPCTYLVEGRLGSAVHMLQRRLVAVHARPAVQSWGLDLNFRPLLEKKDFFSPPFSCLEPHTKGILSLSL